MTIDEVVVLGDDVVMVGDQEVVITIDELLEAAESINIPDGSISAVKDFILEKYEEIISNRASLENIDISDYWFDLIPNIIEVLAKIFHTLAS